MAKNQFLDFVRKKSKGVSVDFDEVEKYVSEGLGTGVKQHKDVENEMVLEKAFEILKNFFYETKNVQFEECQVNYCHIRFL